MGRRPGKRAPIHHHRNLKKETLASMSARLDIHLTTLARLENYKLLPSRAMAEKLANELGNTTGEVIDDYEKNVPAELRKKAS